jgi:hypothetical protein
MSAVLVWLTGMMRITLFDAYYLKEVPMIAKLTKGIKATAETNRRFEPHALQHWNPVKLTSRRQSNQRVIQC